MELKAFRRDFHLPAASRRQAIVALVLSGGEYQRWGAPIEAEARLPALPTEASMYPLASRRGAEQKQNKNS